MLTNPIRDINQTEGVVIRSHPSGESDLVLKILTPELGKIALFVKHARSSKKRYAGLTTSDDGLEEMVFRGLESVRTDWTRLAQNFQRDLYQQIFRAEPYEELIRDYVRNTREGRFDDLLVYRKRLRRELKQYQRNVPPHVRAARLADADNLRHHRPAQYQNGGWISYVMTVAGPEPTTARTSRIDYEHYIQRQLQPIADAILHSINDDFENIVKSQGNLF